VRFRVLRKMAKVQMKKWKPKYRKNQKEVSNNVQPAVSRLESALQSA